MIEAALSTPSDLALSAVEQVIIDAAKLNIDWDSMELIYHPSLSSYASKILKTEYEIDDRRSFSSPLPLSSRVDESLKTDCWKIRFSHESKPIAEIVGRT